MIGEILSYAHRHFRAILLIVALVVLCLAGLGMLDSQNI